MKKWLFPSLMAASLTTKAQRVIYPPPVFPGGDEALAKYLKTQLRYPKMAADSGITGTIFVVFIIDKTGRVQHVETSGAHRGYGLEQEAIRMIKSMPKWSPGCVGDEEVETDYCIPIRFKLED